MNRILHVISSLNVGGAEMMLWRLLKESSNRPNDHHKVISLLPHGELQGRFQDEGIEVFSLDIKHKPFSSCSAIFRIIKDFNPGVVQTWMYHADLVGGVLARLSGFKNVFWGIRSTHVPKGNLVTYLLMKLLALLSYTVPKKIVCVAESAKASHILEGYCAKKMHVISNGYDFDAFAGGPASDVRGEFNIDKQTIVIGCLGRYHSDKGQDLFIQAVAKLPYKNFKFMLVGRECTWENEKLVACIAKHRLEKFFVLAGERNDVASCLSAFDIFCMPSRTEGFPNSLAEAMLMELPCVAFDVGDANKLSGIGVELVPANDIDGLSKTLHNLASLTLAERKEIGSKASERVNKNFSIKTIYSEYLNNYELV